MAEVLRSLPGATPAAPAPTRRAGRARSARTRRTPFTYALRFIVVAYVFLLVAWPLGLVATNTFSDGFAAFRDSLSDPSVTHAIQLSVVVALQAVVINTIFGVTISILLVRYRFPGRRLLSILVDLPLAVSPVVVGLALILVYSTREGWFGAGLSDAGFQIIFATPGMVMATAFVSLPLVVREVAPVLEEVGTDQEEAARSLGANAVQTFRRITLPAIKWALIYGVVLTLARSLGEFGAVKIVSGNFEGQTQTATLSVEQKYQDFQQQSAYAISFVLASVSVLCIIVVSFLRPKDEARR